MLYRLCIPAAAADVPCPLCGRILRKLKTPQANGQVPCACGAIFVIQREFLAIKSKPDRRSTVLAAKFHVR